MTHHTDLPMNPHAGTESIGLTVDNDSLASSAGLPSDTVLTLEGVPEAVPTFTTIPAISSSPAGFDEIPAEALEVPAPSASELQAQEQKKQEEEPLGLSFLPNAENTQQDHEVFFELEADWNDAGTFIVGQADTQERTAQALDAMPNIDLQVTESGRDWVDYMIESMNTAPSKDQWRRTADRPSAAWRQTVESERGKISMGALNFGNMDSSVLSGEKAVLRVRALTGLGSVIQVPLWHSGFHVTIKAPGETALINLNQRLLDEKVILGRTTNGLAFANTSSYMTGWILDFVMDYIYDTSLQEKDKTRIRSMIQSPDLPILFWGLACSIWPRGFQYARPYIDPQTKVETLLKEKLMVGKLLWVDIKSLTDWQVKHMSNRGSASMSNEMVKRYRDDFVIGQPRKVKLSEHISVTLRVPNAVEFVKCGYDWIGGIMREVDQAFEQDAASGRRADFVMRQAKASAMRQYTHWIDTIHVGNGSIIDRDTIDSTLSDLSADDAIRSTFFDEVQTYIDDVTMAIIATPAALHEDRKAKTFPKFPRLLPMNVEHTFFTLLEQKVIQISQRP